MKGRTELRHANRCLINSVVISFALGIVGCWFIHPAAALETVPASVRPIGSLPDEIPVVERLSCLTGSRIASVRSDPVRGVQLAFEACAAEVTKKTGSLRLTEEEKRITFVSVLAHSMAPYGPSQSTSLTDLLNDKEMDCDNYALLTGQLHGFLEGSQDQMRFVGFDGGAVGNHAQMFIETNAGLMLDPTIGLVARIGFNDLLQGKTLPGNQILLFRQHADDNLESFRNRVHDSILKGKYKPGDLLYFFDSIGGYLRFSNDIRSMWGKDTDALLLRFPTPAAGSLRRNLRDQNHTR